LCGGRSRNQRIEKPIHDGLELGRARPQGAGSSEQVLEERYQHYEGEAVKHGSEHRRAEAEEEQATVRRDELEKPDLGAHLSRAGA
jgi:hypothetical protein